MTETYLLYIDILGFSDLVARDPSNVDALYRIIDRLNVHKHHAFRAIAFSDTILAYNTFDLHSEHDHEYAVMYSCEFAQDLLYRLVGHGLYFRAILVFGGFSHYALSNVQCFYGSSVIAAYRAEKKLPALGLFITDECNAHNRIFPTAPFDSGIRFVYLNQCLESLQTHTEGQLPSDPIFVTDTDEYHRILWDLRYLADIRSSGRTEARSDVRAKHLATYDLYRLRYPRLLAQFEAAAFAPEPICPSFNWSARKEAFQKEIAQLGG